MLVGTAGFVAGGTDEPLYMQLMLGGPTLSYHYVTHPKLKAPSHIVGLGASLKWQLTWQPSDYTAFTLQWVSILQVTNAYATSVATDEVALGIGDSKVVLWGANEERAWHLGTLSFIFNWRFPTYINTGF